VSQTVPDVRLRRIARNDQSRLTMASEEPRGIVAAR
jgi:hypothetical protein